MNIAKEFKKYLKKRKHFIKKELNNIISKEDFEKVAHKFAIKFLEENEFYVTEERINLLKGIFSELYLFDEEKIIEKIQILLKTDDNIYIFEYFDKLDTFEIENIKIENDGNIKLNCSGSILARKKFDNNIFDIGNNIGGIIFEIDLKDLLEKGGF